MENLEFVANVLVENLNEQQELVSQIHINCILLSEVVTLSVAERSVHLG